jgi:hypothetical protein
MTHSEASLGMTGQTTVTAGIDRVETPPNRHKAALPKAVTTATESGIMPVQAPQEGCRVI